MTTGRELPPFPGPEDGGPATEVARVVWLHLGGPPPSNPRRVAYLRWRQAAEETEPESDDDLPPAA